MKEELIQYLELFHPFTSEEQQIIAEAFEWCSYKDRDVLFPADKVCNKMFFILKGVLRIATINNKGIDVTLYFYSEHHFCTIIPSFKEQKVTEASIQACCNTDVLMITKARLLQLYDRVPAVKEVIDGILQQNLMEKVIARNLHLGASAMEIYKHFLIHQPDIAMRVSQKDIAGFLGITPQSLSRLRKQML